MPYKNNTLVGLNTILSFGKYKGRSVASVYCGNMINIILIFRNMIDNSLSLIFNEDFYGDSDMDNVAKISSGWDGDTKRVNQTELRYFVSALKEGATCNYEMLANSIIVKVQKSDGKQSAELSRIGCKVAKEYITRFFGKIDLSHTGYPPMFTRPAIVSSSQSNNFEEEITQAEGDPNYIYWCISNVDDFCMNGNAKGIYGLNNLPVFNLDNIQVKAGKIKEDFSFEFDIEFKSEFINVDQDVIKLNFDKYRAYIKKKTAPYFPEEVFHDEMNDSHNNSDDEENIMRGLESGNGDQFGF